MLASITIPVSSYIIPWYDQSKFLDYIQADYDFKTPCLTPHRVTVAFSHHVVPRALQKKCFLFKSCSEYEAVHFRMGALPVFAPLSSTASHIFMNTSSQNPPKLKQSNLP